MNIPVRTSCSRCPAHSDETKPCNKVLDMKKSVEDLIQLDLEFALKEIVKCRQVLSAGEDDKCFYNCNEFMAFCLDLVTEVNRMAHIFVPSYQSGIFIEETHSDDTLISALYELFSEDNSIHSISSTGKIHKLRQKYSIELSSIKSDVSDRKRIIEKILELIDCHEHFLKLKQGVLSKIREDKRNVLETIAFEKGHTLKLKKMNHLFIYFMKSRHAQACK